MPKTKIESVHESVSSDWEKGQGHRDKRAEPNKTRRRDDLPLSTNFDVDNLATNQTLTGFFHHRLRAYVKEKADNEVLVREGISLLVQGASWLVPGHSGLCSASTSALRTSWMPAPAAVSQPADLDFVTGKQCP